MNVGNNNADQNTGDNINTRSKQFFQSDQGLGLREELTKMSESEQYNTRSMYSASDNDKQTFVDKHMKYMSMYPNLNHLQYISTLKLMTKIAK